MKNLALFIVRSIIERHRYTREHFDADVRQLTRVLWNSFFMGAAIGLGIGVFVTIMVGRLG